MLNGQTKSLTNGIQGGEKGSRGGRKRAYSTLDSNGYRDDVLPSPAPRPGIPEIRRHPGAHDRHQWRR